MMMKLIHAIAGALALAPASTPAIARARTVARNRMVDGALLIMLMLLALILVSPAHAQSALEFAAQGMGTSKVSLQGLEAGVQGSRRRAAPLDIRSVPQQVAEAAKYVGTRNPYRFRGPGCKVFVNMIARRSGLYANASARAFDTRSMGQRVSYPQPGDYRVSARRGGGHVELVAAVDGGSVTTINGNKGGNRVGWSRRPIGGAAYYRPIRVAAAY